MLLIFYLYYNTKNNLIFALKNFKNSVYNLIIINLNIINDWRKYTKLNLKAILRS